MSSHSNRNNANAPNIDPEVDDVLNSLSEYPDSDTFRILIVTDTHLGHLERDEVRRYDSFRAFDEALSIGKQYNVDFVLHAGDLFDKNQPSRFCMVKTLHILRKHCLGNKAIHFEVVSDQSKNFPSTGRVNYEDPNYNISLPIFIQHGNHDDPAGLGNHAALEQLSATNLLNYVGRVDDLENVVVFPILMQKGTSKLAIYPLGFIRDERLHRAFLHHKVKWVKPKQNNNDATEWFNIAMVHQNRTRHTQQYKDCIPEEFLPKFLDVVYWGHEHECCIDLTESLTGNFFITQPGSTVITSLSQSEAKAKYCGIMEIKNDECRLIPFKLRTSRPFIFDDLVLDDHFEHDVDIQDIHDFLVDKVNTLIDTAQEEFPDPSQLDDHHLSFVTNYTEREQEHGDISRLPLIRLRVDHSHFPKIRSAQFGQSFLKKVANPDDILLFHKKSAKKQKNENQDGAERQMRGGNLFNISTGMDQTKRIQDIVTDNITNDSSDPLTMFPELDLLKSIQDFVDKEDPHSIEEYCDHRLEEIAQKLIESECNALVEDISTQSSHHTNNRRKILRQQREMQLLQKEDDEKMEVDVVKNENINVKKNIKKKKKEIEVLVDDEEEEEVILPKKRKANLNSFGFGMASQNHRENVINSQNDDEFHLKDIKNKKGIKSEGSVKKKRKISDDEYEGNDVLDSLLGFNDDDEDEDVDMNRNNNHNKSNRVLRSQVSNTQKSLDEYGLSVVSQSQSRRSTSNSQKTQNTQNGADDDDDDDTQTQRRRRHRKSGKQKKGAWGNLLSRRANR